MSVDTIDISKEALQDWLDAHSTATISKLFVAGSFIFIIYSE